MLENLRMGIVQRVLPGYRAELFDVLAELFPGGISVFAGDARPNEMISSFTRMETTRFTYARNIHLFRGLFYLCWQRGMLDWLERWNPDVLILEANPRYLSSCQAVKWMHARHRKVIGWGLGAPEITGFGSRIRFLFRHRFLSRFDGMIAYSRTGAEQYIAAGLPASCVFVAPNAAARRPVRFLARKMNPGSCRVLFVGRLQNRKRVDMLIHACADLPEGMHPDLWIVGNGPIAPNLEELAGEIYPSTRFFGELHGEDLQSIFQQADLFVLPGTGGLAVQEAMAAGLPVIVAEGDGTQDDLVRPENGWRVAPGDQSALTTALADALQDRERLHRMGLESHRIVMEEINLEKMAAAFEHAIRVVLGDDECTS